MLPRVILHSAVSADGRIDWFAADIGLFYQIISRWHEDATLGGSDTLLNAPGEIPPEAADDLNPPARDPNDTRPLLVVPDSRGRIRTWHYWRKQPYWRDIVVLCAQATPQEYLNYLAQRRITYIIAGDERVDYRQALEPLNVSYGIGVVRVDSGGTLNGILLRAGLVDEISVLLHPALVGGVSPKSFFRAPDLSSPEGIIPLKLVHFEQMDNQIVWLVYEVMK